MRIFVRDYGVHPFPVQLSRELARRGHVVHHLYAPFFQSPKGGLVKTPDDPDGRTIEALDIGEPFHKYAFLPRLRQEIRYGHMAADRVRAFRPDVAIGCTIPLDPQNIYLRACRGIAPPPRLLAAGFLKLGDFVDPAPKVPGDRPSRRLALHGARMPDDPEQRRRRRQHRGFPAASARVGRRSRADPCHRELGADRGSAGARPGDGLSGKRVILYSGTLGMKRNPALLLELALRCRDRSDIEIVVNSEGPGEEWLRREGAVQGLDNLVLLPFQPYKRFPEVLASADILTEILEPDAGVFSVLSKVLSYLCAARPVFAAIPPENLAARVAAGNDAGRVAAPHDVEAFAAHSEALLADPGLRATLGRNARAYAESRFRIKDIGERFEAILSATKWN